MPKKSVARKPLKISIHTDGVDIDAIFDKPSKFSGIVEKLAEQLTQRPTSPPRKTEHDFDVMKRVIEVGEPAVLKAFIDLANAELERRATVS